MKNIYIILSWAILSMFCWSCSDEKEENEKTSLVYADFLQHSLNVPSAAGEVISIVECAGAQWEIVMENNEGMITSISQKQGGNTGEQKRYDQIKISYSENTGLKSRTQEIFLVNKMTGERTKLVISQNPKYSSFPITLDATTKYQYIDGFGGAHSEPQWTDGRRLTLANMETIESLGYNIIHIYINDNGKQLWLDNIETLQDATRRGMKIFASGGITKEFREEDGVDEDGKTKYRFDHEKRDQEYAEYLADFVTALKNKGVEIYAISMQNEPDMGPYWTPAQMTKFVKDYGHIIRATGAKILGPEACGFDPNLTNAVVDHADIIAGHLYQGFMDLSSSYVKNRYNYIRSLYPEKLAPAGKTSWWMTEHLFNDGVKFPDDPTQWQWWKWDYVLSHLGQEVHMCMDAYCSAYIYFYVKRNHGLIGDGEVMSPVPVNEITKNGYILSHYAKYALGMTRIKVETENDKVKTTAYINEEGTEMTAVLINMEHDDFNALITAPNEIANVSAVETTEDTNMMAAVTNLDDAYTASVLIPAKSIVSVRLKLR